MNENLKEEIWKDIEGYEGLYQVSNLGKVKSLNYLRTGKEKILKPAKMKDGYLFVRLCKNKKVKKFYVHRLVASTFIPNPNNLPEVNHRDENPGNNCVDNLEWCDSKYNINYGTRNKRVTEKRSKPILQYDLENNLIKEWLSGKEIERRLGFSRGNVSMCCNNQRKTAYGYVWRFKEKEVA